MITTLLDVWETSRLRWQASRDVLGTLWDGAMANERLRAGMLQRGLTPATLGELLGVDTKSVERWVGGRIPYRKHRYAVAAQLKLDEAYLWPDALAPAQVAGAGESEFLSVYPHRWAVPRDAWGRLFDAAEHQIGVLVYSGLFLADDAGILSMLRAKAGAGVGVRVLVGDPESHEVLSRSESEGIDDALAAKIRNAIALYRPLLTVDGFELRTHRTPLYNSIYWADDELLVNAHVYGVPASQAPVLHLRRVAGGDVVTTYIDSFERVWADARTLE